jgi:hypothetical protein
MAPMKDALYPGYVPAIISTKLDDHPKIATQPPKRVKKPQTAPTATPKETGFNFIAFSLDINNLKI